MTALTAARSTPQMMGLRWAYPLAAATTVMQGSLVALDAGYLVPGHEATGLVAVGRAEEGATSADAGDAAVTVRPGVFRWENSAAGDLITQAEVGTDCYIVDDQTVAKTSSGGDRSVAGRVVAVDDSGVWVATGVAIQP